MGGGVVDRRVGQEGVWGLVMVRAAGDGTKGGCLLGADVSLPGRTGGGGATGLAAFEAVACLL